MVVLGRPLVEKMVVLVEAGQIREDVLVARGGEVSCQLLLLLLQLLLLPPTTGIQVLGISKTLKIRIYIRNYLIFILKRTHMGENWQCT
jgi:hypothetical protein